MRTVSIFFLALFPLLLAAQHTDLDLLKKINPRHPSSDFWSVTSSSAYWVPPSLAGGTIITGIIKKDKGLRRNGYEVVISTAISAGFSEVLKRSFNRKRPAESFPLEVFPAEEKSGRSFPSGHTIMAFAMATTVSLQYKKWYVVVPAYVWAGAVGYSRMYRGVHYPSDVLGGAVVGIGTGYLSHWLTQKIFK